VAGVVDPSASLRAYLAERWGVAAVETAGALMAMPLDGVVIATPDCYHADLAVLALQRGLHVFCEKPLCYAPVDADAVAAARDRAGRVVQLGYMKRFDPAYRHLRELVAGQGERLRYLSVEVNDPDFWPFVAHRDYFEGQDVATELIEDARARRHAQVWRALGIEPAPALETGYAKPFCSSLVHDVNLGHGLLEAMGLETASIVSASFFAVSEAGHAAVRLRPGDALWNMAHVAVPKLADYLEIVTLFFDDRVYELSFPAPYLNHAPTRLVEKLSKGHHARTVEHRPSYQEPFVEELKAWWRAIINGEPVENSVEQAKADVALLAAFGRRACAAA
jgi:predicted dehydrogenase